ncbi:hypothetical protein F4780DRAFT_791801 [Xylariomycetidae sp. FL0641]|nr:hypothetical protein F4780DRAFT_791801 [Xylariomycetidae sp. FL0641]
MVVTEPSYTSPTTPVKQPTKDDWLSAKPMIYELYVVQSLKLHDVRALLEAQGFLASESMYKKHLQAWARSDPTWRKQRYTKSAHKRGKKPPGSELRDAALQRRSPVPDDLTYTYTAAAQAALTQGLRRLYRRHLRAGRWDPDADAGVTGDPRATRLCLSAFKLVYCLEAAGEREAGLRRTLAHLRRAVRGAGSASCCTLLPTILLCVIHMQRTHDADAAASRFLAAAAAEFAAAETPRPDGVHPPPPLTAAAVLRGLLVSSPAGAGAGAEAALERCVAEAEGGSLFALTWRSIALNLVAEPGSGSTTSTSSSSVATLSAGFAARLRRAEQDCGGRRDSRPVLAVLASWLFLLEADPGGSGGLRARLTEEMVARVGARYRRGRPSVGRGEEEEEEDWAFLGRWEAMRAILVLLRQEEGQLAWLSRVGVPGEGTASY